MTKKANIINEVMTELKARGYEPITNEVVKNGVTKTGITITGLGVAPTIYAEDILDRDIDEVITVFIKHIEDGKRFADFNANFTWDNVKDNILPYLAGASRVDTDLWKRVDDTDLCYGVRYFLTGLADGETATVKFTEDLVKWLGVDKETVFRQAVANIDKYAEYMDLADYLHLPMPCGAPTMYFLRYKHSACFGAGAILSEKMRGELSALFGGDYVVIPSSINEVLLVPATDEARMLGDMIKTVNAMEVSPEEILSDHAYRFNVTTSSLMSL